MPPSSTRSSASSKPVSGRRKPAASKKSPAKKTLPVEPQEFPISNSMLRFMYDAMIESRQWSQSRKLRPAMSEATAVATASVLHRTDTLAAPPDGRTLYPVTSPAIKVIPLEIPRVRAACESARKKRRGAVVAICPEEDCNASLFHLLLAEAHRRLWPLICVVLTDHFSNPEASIPEIDVDGHDAVAIFRVISESVRRARNRRGPAIIHAHGATQIKTRKRGDDPLVRFHRYLKAKGLTTKGLHVAHQGAQSS